MLTQRRGENLDAWIRDVDARGAAPLRSFTNGLRTDLAAVAAGLTPRTAPERSKARSPASRRLGGRCTAAPDSACSANESSTPREQLAATIRSAAGCVAAV
jgi:hypothetical protein